MKTNSIRFRFIVFFVCSLTFAKSFSQDSGTDSRQDISGKWIAKCATEFVDHATIRNCELCPFVIDPVNKSRAEIKDIEMSFQKDSVILNRGGEISAIPYLMNKDNRSISFNFNKKNYDFRLFYIEDEFILEDSDGLVILLRRAD